MKKLRQKGREELGAQVPAASFLPVNPDCHGPPSVSAGDGCAKCGPVGAKAQGQLGFPFALLQFRLGPAGHTPGRSPNQLTLWGGSGPQVSSQRTAAPRHTGRCRGAAGSGPGGETRVSAKEGEGVGRALGQGTPLGRQQKPGGRGVLVKAQIARASPPDFLIQGLRTCISNGPWCCCCWFGGHPRPHTHWMYRVRAK